MCVCIYVYMVYVSCMCVHALVLVTVYRENDRPLPNSTYMAFDVVVGWRASFYVSIYTTNITQRGGEFLLDRSEKYDQTFFVNYTWRQNAGIPLYTTTQTHIHAHNSRLHFDFSLIQREKLLRLSLVFLLFYIHAVSGDCWIVCTHMRKVW